MCRVDRTNAEKKSILLEEDPRIQQQPNGREGCNAKIKRVMDHWKPHYYMCRVSQTNVEKKSILQEEDPWIQP